MKDASPDAALSAESPLANQLATGIDALNLDCPLDVQAQLLDYVRLLHKWNRVYNLTAVREPEQMVTRHLLDSLTIWPYLRGQRFLDVGTGAGLPGIPLALMRSTGHLGREFATIPKQTSVVHTALQDDTRIITHIPQVGKRYSATFGCL